MFAFNDQTKLLSVAKLRNLNVFVLLQMFRKFASTFANRAFKKVFKDLGNQIYEDLFKKSIEKNDISGKNEEKHETPNHEVNFFISNLSY
jgi:hypothetical protein